MFDSTKSEDPKNDLDENFDSRTEEGLAKCDEDKCDEDKCDEDKCNKQFLNLTLKTQLIMGLILGFIVGGICWSGITYWDKPLIKIMFYTNVSDSWWAKFLRNTGDFKFIFAMFGLIIVTEWVIYKRSTSTIGQSKQQFFKNCLYKLLYILITVFSAGSLVAIAKFIFGRPRPSFGWAFKLNNFQWFEVKGDLNSFPSGHASTQTGFFLALCFLYPRLWLWWITCLIISLPSSVIVKHHFATDVIFGAYLTLIVAIIVINIYRKYQIQPFQMKHPVE
jgi:membrane-associated phospholipid phosphatase